MSAPLEIAITDEVESGLEEEFLRNAITTALRVGGGVQRHVSLLLTDDATIAEVHGEFLGDPTPTDVISFELDEETVDLVVSVECARRRASSMHHAWDAEVALYVVHGVLHACGYDDHGDDERARMRDAERDVLSQLGLQVTRVDGESSAFD